MAGQPVTFAMLLRRHRQAAGLTQDELAEAAGLHPHTISDLERGYALKPHGETVRLLADALKLTGPAREQLKAAARRYYRAHGSAATATEGDDATVSGRLPRDPRAWLTFIVTTLDDAGEAAALSAMTQWKDSGSADAAWLAWVEELITFTAEGRLPPAARRPLPTISGGPFLDREQQTAELNAFVDRIQQGRGGLALILGPSGIGKSRLAAQVLARRLNDSQAEWITLARGEAGYQGWRRLLAPLWKTIRRTELAPASLLTHASTLDDVLLAGTESEVAGMLPQRQVAAAVAALLAHEASRKPLVLIIDDAHRGGISSDHLLLDLAPRVNACRVGLIAALRPDELDKDSPLRGYSGQVSGRAAVDVVTPIHLPPLDIGATAELLSQRMEVIPPAEIVEQVVRQTGGRPQLIDNIDVQAPKGATGGSWMVKLGAEGLSVLLDTIDSRTEAVRDVLRAAAVCADGACVEAELVARIAGQDQEFVERILDEECRGPILVPQASRYCFQHDNWIDALVDSCPRPRLRTLRARCFVLLRADPASDPRRLLQHALGAGTAHVGPEELVALASQAAELDVANYAFSAAAQRYEVAARYAADSDQVNFMVKQSHALRFCGRWREARGVLQEAARRGRRLGMPEHEAIALVQLERLTWTYGLDERELTQQYRDVMTRLPAGEMVLRAQVQAALAARLSIVPRQHENEQADLARMALQQLSSVTDPLAAAEIVIGSRTALQDIASPEELLSYDRQALEFGLQANSAFHIAEALEASIADLLRAGRLGELASAVRQHRDFAERSTAPTVMYAQALFDAMLALAHGEFEAASRYTAEAGTWSKDWGGSMAHEALMAQAGWLLYETGQVDALTDFLADLPGQAVSTMNEEVWRLGAGLIYAERGQAKLAIERLRDVCTNTGDLRDTPRGPSRIGILATAAMVLGHPVLDDAMLAEEAHRLGTNIVELLADHPDRFVLAGWPAVLLGSKHRYIGLAYLAARQPERAVQHLAQAAEENSAFEVLHARTRFDLARALIRQPDSYAEGLDEMQRVRQQAVNLKMQRLAEQAAGEQNHSPS
jgi:transcriptional regulator with XRE-family HTH domain/tetratricopeptide (TPR) repeat protein